MKFIFTISGEYINSEDIYAISAHESDICNNGESSWCVFGYSKDGESEYLLSFDKDYDTARDRLHAIAAALSDDGGAVFPMALLEDQVVTGKLERQLERIEEEST